MSENKLKADREATELENVVYKLNQNNGNYDNLVDRLYNVVERLKSTTDAKTSNEEEKKSKEPYDLMEKLDYGLNRYENNNSRINSLLCKLETLI